MVLPDCFGPVIKTNGYFRAESISFLESVIFIPSIVDFYVKQQEYYWMCPSVSLFR